MILDFLNVLSCLSPSLHPILLTWQNLVWHRPDPLIPYRVGAYYVMSVQSGNFIRHVGPYDLRIRLA